MSSTVSMRISGAWDHTLHRAALSEALRSDGLIRSLALDGHGRMVKVTLTDRKSRALTPSSLRCLSHLPTINMTAGCVHGCAYCYIRGYSQYPGDGAVTVYRNTAEQVERELLSKIKRNKQLPLAVYFCPSSDAFMPVDEVLDQSYCTMALLLGHHGIGVQFVTKGAIPDRFFDLFAQHPDIVAGQVGLTALDESLNAAIEPGAAPPQQRLEDLARLVDIGVTTSLRADPLILGVTDGDDDLAALFTEVAKRGIRDVSASYLFLRPAITGSLRRSIHDAVLLRRILAPFDGVSRSTICCSGGAGTFHPVEVRRSQLDRVNRIAEQCGLQMRICGCKNSELTNSKCHLANLAATTHTKQQAPAQTHLW